MTNKSKTKFGFTLAEVLITLGIIGVVAAMTIPVLITNYQKHVTVTKLQKAISILNQAYKLSYDDVGEPSAAESYAMGSEEYFKQYWAPYIKTAVICTTYQQCGYNKTFPWSFRNGNIDYTAVVNKDYRVTFSTSDGFLYMILTGKGTGNKDEYNKNTEVLVDINGAEGPNIHGHDLFVLTRVDKDGGGIQPYGYNFPSAAINNDCSKKGNGKCCAEKIRRAGWKIEKDYPW